MGKAMGHYRLTSAAMGDDTTLTRYVRNNNNNNNNNGAVRHKQRQPRLPTLEAMFIQEGRTKFTKAIRRVDQLTRLLVDGHSNVKIGHDVRKGKFKGYHIFTLSLEERKTCPSTCQHWQTCYGNNMPFAKRIDHTDPAFLPTLELEIASLMAKPWPGVLIRLHALGDFYSCAYVAFWDRMLRLHPRLSIYGYSAHPNKSSIGWTLHHLRMEWGYRAMIRMSNAPYPVMSTVTIGTPESRPENAFICPEQTRQTQCCATCGLCWSTRKNVAFLEH